MSRELQFRPARAEDAGRLQTIRETAFAPICGHRRRSRPRTCPACIPEGWLRGRDSERLDVPQAIAEPTPRTRSSSSACSLWVPRAYVPGFITRSRRYLPYLWIDASPSGTQQSPGRRPSPSQRQDDPHGDGIERRLAEGDGSESGTAGVTGGLRASRIGISLPDRDRWSHSRKASLRPR